VVGLSYKAGAGADVCLAAKARHAPTALKVARINDYIQNTLRGIKQTTPYTILYGLQSAGYIRLQSSLGEAATCVMQAIRSRTKR